MYDYQLKAKKHRCILNGNKSEVINYLNSCANEFKSSIIVATHDPEFREFSDKILTMDSGVFV